MKTRKEVQVENTCHEMKNEGSNGERKAAGTQLVRTAAALDLLYVLLLFSIRKLFVDAS